MHRVYISLYHDTLSSAPPTTTDHAGRDGAAPAGAAMDEHDAAVREEEERGRVPFCILLRWRVVATVIPSTHTPPPPPNEPTLQDA